MVALAWILGIGLLWLLFDGYLDRLNNPNRHLEVSAGAERAELVLRSNPGGHYVAPGIVNGRPVTFMLDTGATLVSVPQHLGAALGLEPGARHQVRTANGTVTARATRIEELGLGPFHLRNVSAHLNPGMKDDQILLGMSALRHFEFHQRNGTLILRPPVAD